MFTNVLKKFFTERFRYENKVATEIKQGPPPMLNDLKATVSRNPMTLVKDAAGAVSLVLILVMGLHLPGLY